MSVQDLEKRVAALEQEISILKRMLLPGPGGEAPNEAAVRMLREAEAVQPIVEANLAKTLEQMGLRGEPISAEELQQMMAARGVKPEDNEFSRELIAMRECSRPPLPKEQE